MLALNANPIELYVEIVASTKVYEAEGKKVNGYVRS